MRWSSAVGACQLSSSSLAPLPHWPAPALPARHHLDRRSPQPLFSPQLDDRPQPYLCRVRRRPPHSPPVLLVAASLAPSLVSAERSADAARENSVVARSLAEFLACLPRSNLHVQLAPGTYPLTRPLAFSGSDSTYDLIGVRFEYRIAEVGAINVNGIVVHGNESRLLNCTVMSHTFGHGIALHETPQNTLIRGCTVTGSLRHTDDILRETSGPAFQRNFKMYTDAPIPPHKVISASEDGIRVYGPKTRGVTIENTTIKHMRGGLGLEAALPPVRVTGCRIIECEYACYIGTDAVVENTEADARHGPALVTFAAKPGSDHPYPADHRNSRVELRILDSTNPSGPHPIARLGLLFPINARNITEGGRLQPITANPDGSPNAFRIIEPRRLIFSVSFEL